MGTLVFISQLMRGLTEAAILNKRKIAEEMAKEHRWTVIDTYYTDSATPLEYLGRSISAMSGAHFVIFVDNWEDGRGCRLEWQAAKEYGKTILYFNTKTKELKAGN
ncbi:MAG: DUF4406 domain-containing protein [Elusimicrobiota bacterium]|jgi:hypothetical protein|nr:DUF4406 domain-containing protein [Elusimicrobiota bacterium]